MQEDLASFRRIAFLFAVADEMRPLASRLTERKKERIGDKIAVCGKLGAREVLLVAGGMGARRAARTTEWIAAGWLPGAVMIAGVAGALSADLQRGDVLTASTVHTDQMALTPSLNVAGVTPGRLLSIDRVLVTSVQKQAALQALKDPTGPIAVEMETAAAAVVAERHRIPWGALRAISDGAEESLPLDFNLLRDREGDLPVSTVALVAMRRPQRIPGLVRLGAATNHAAKALAEAVCRSLA